MSRFQNEKKHYQQKLDCGTIKVGVYIKRHKKQNLKNKPEKEIRTFLVKIGG